MVIDSVPQMLSINQIFDKSDFFYSQHCLNLVGNFLNDTLLQIIQAFNYYFRTEKDK